MAAAAFLALALVHLLVWFRVHSEIKHLLFAVTLGSAAANAIAEANMYRSESIETMAEALRWYVTTSGLWALATCGLSSPMRVSRLSAGLSRS